MGVIMTIPPEIVSQITGGKKITDGSIIILINFFLHACNSTIKPLLR